MMLAKWINTIAKDLMKIIKKKGVVYPPYENEMHYNDEICTGVFVEVQV